MFIVLLVFAVLAVAGIIFYLITELNELEKTVTALAEKLRKRYEP
jgi:Tfp pilus assembly protein PilO